MSSVSEVWEKVVDELKKDMSPTSVTTWFNDAEPIHYYGSSFVLFTPNIVKKQTIETQYKPVISAALRRILHLDSVDLIVINEISQRRKYVALAKRQPSVCDTYTFDNFIVGNSNRFAQAAAYAVATKPASSAAYNPLFIYGPSGLGKTHLLYAIANKIKESNPNYSIVYIKGDEFTNELIGSLQTNAVESFRQKYRDADLFLVDDVQFIAGKERTQEEFFHTFNTLHENGKQIVLTSDRPPREMYTLEDRLRTRFEWGLLSDIQPPDYETRVAIISKKAETLGISLPPDVLEYIAGAIKNNVRQLEGAVKKMCALKELLDQNINIRLAEQAISDIMLESPGLAPTPPLIVNEVAVMFGVPATKLLGTNRSKEYVTPRHIAMYLVRILTTMSLPEIGKVFNRDHSTVLTAINKIEGQIKTDPAISRQIKDLIKNIESR